MHFVCDVFDGRETIAAHTVDADGLLIHAEVQVGDSTIMVCDAKPRWGFLPALLQVYVSNLEEPVRRARALGAELVTEPTGFHGGQRLARLQDPWRNVWWLFEYTADSVAPSEAAAEAPRWRPDPAAPPSYVHRTIDQALAALRLPHTK